MPASTNTTRLAVDIGGTFTDVVLETPARTHTTKVLTTPRAPELGVMDGIGVVLAEAGLDARAIDVVIHGTTLATNALIERKGARTAFVTTEGFRDVLEMGFEKRYAQYDLAMEMPPPLVPRPLRFAVPGRVVAGGGTLVPLDADAVRSVGAALRRAEVEAVAVGFLHAYAHPEMEREAAAILAEALPDATVCLSGEVCPELREYERFSTTVANAYVRPLMSGYLHRLRGLLDREGLAAPLYLMMSGGGLTTLEQAARFPIRLVESGPAGGAILAARLAAQCGFDRVLSYDMGGTTAKICLIDDGRPQRSRTFEIARIYRDMKGSGLPVRIPVIEMVEIGAGGGSIARVDALGRITVGPDSAGSEPGPASYGRGGARPTVTDANLDLGKLDAEGFAGGRIRLDAAAARAALARDVGSPLGLDAHWPAVGVVEMVEENMANAARVHAIERGRDVTSYTMIAFGGAAPLHAARLAEKLGIRRVLVPVGAGVGSAIGFLAAPIAYEVVRSFRRTLSDLPVGEANRLVDAMADEARAVVRRGAGDAPLTEERKVELRYRGQGHELVVDLPGRPLDDGDRALLRAAFEERYRRVYGLVLPDIEVEAVSWSVTVSTRPAEVEPVADPGPRRRAEPAASRPAYDASLGRMVEHAVHERTALSPGDRLDGPAVIVEAETATMVPAGFTARLHPAGHILLERNGA
ncbi:hydantoinase/oxoprolinase family protein [Arenibaculum sp.]|uniref:hydantoinase/oxoprolinase family protein n=1 Tax=Arenibaculum sp. TaxID=2865862 RepID=UPI002E0F0D0C|nr:hydantoinase/oxoprolinase family protein [Arenibaculum sp.]